MKKKLTITGTFNDSSTNYENKESSVVMIVDDVLDCTCSSSKKCFIHREVKGYVLSDIPDEKQL